MAVGLCLAMETRKSKTALKVTAVSFLVLAAAGLMLRAHGAEAAGQAATQPMVRGIAVHKGADGTVIIDVSVTGSVPYRTFQLSGPDRLVVDLNGAHESGLKGEYPAQSPLLKRVRTSQWKNDPAVVRVVADVKGNPSFNVRKQASGIRIELKPRGENLASSHRSGVAGTHRAADSGGPEWRTAREGLSPNKVFQVHRFKDLSASLTAPALPSHDKLVPVGDPDLPQPHHQEASTPARMSGISILPGSQGETTFDIVSSKSVPYHVFQLADPFRLVIDLKDARDASNRKVYPVNSPVLKRVRVGQWRPDDTSVVRVVADLEGYPIFDVHAQQPGIRIELRPRYVPGALMRNPFQFQEEPQRPRDGYRGTQANQAVTAGAGALAPDDAFSGLKVIGFIEKAGGGTQAVISHNSGVYLVPKGGTFENTFIVLAISADAVEVQNINTLKTTWITYSPQ